MSQVKSAHHWRILIHLINWHSLRSWQRRHLRLIHIQINSTHLSSHGVKLCLQLVSSWIRSGAVCAHSRHLLHLLVSVLAHWIGKLAIGVVATRLHAQLLLLWSSLIHIWLLDEVLRQDVLYHYWFHFGVNHLWGLGLPVLVWGLTFHFDFNYSKLFFNIYCKF